MASASPSKYASPAPPKRRRSFDEGGLHIVEADMSADCVVERESRPAVHVVTRGYLEKQGFVHCRPLFMQVNPQKTFGESISEAAIQRYDLTMKHAMTVGTSPDCDITIEDATQTLGSTHAKIFNKHGCTWFQDLGTSEHGTCLILGHAKGGRDEYCLCTGDEFRIGQDNGISVKVLEIHREVKTEFYRKKKIFDRAHSKMSNFDFAEQKVVESKSTVASGAGNGKSYRARRAASILRPAPLRRWDASSSNLSPLHERAEVKIQSAPQLPRKTQESTAPRRSKSMRRVLFHESSEMKIGEEIVTVPTASMGFFVSHIMEKTGEPIVKIEIERSSDHATTMVKEPTSSNARRKSGRHSNLGAGGISSLSRTTVAAVASRGEQLKLQQEQKTYIQVASEKLVLEEGPDRDADEKIFALPESPSKVRIDSQRSRYHAAEGTTGFGETLKQVTTVHETKMVLAVRRRNKDGNEEEELLNVDPQEPPVSFGTSASCRVVVAETVSGTILGEHCTIDYRHGSFFLTISKIEGLSELDGIDDESNIDDRKANRRARDRERALKEQEQNLHSVLVKISASSHGGARNITSAFSELCAYDRLLLGRLEAEIRPPRTEDLCHAWKRAGIQVSVGGHTGGGQAGVGEDTAESLGKAKQEEAFVIVGTGSTDSSLVVGRKDETCDLALHKLEHKEMAQVGGEHVRIYRRELDKRFYAHTMPAGRFAGLYLLLGRGMVGGNRGHVLTPGDIFRIGRSQIKVIACKAKGRGIRYGDARHYGRGKKDARDEIDQLLHEDEAKPSFTSHYQIEDHNDNNSKNHRVGHLSPSSVDNDEKGNSSHLSEHELRWGTNPMDNPDFRFLPHFIIVEALSGPRTGRQFPLNEQRITLGKSEDATITLNDRTLEAFHSFIELGSDGLYRLNDLETDAGTFLRVDNVGGDIRLDLGDVLSLGAGHTELVIWGEMEDETRVDDELGGGGGCGCAIS